MSGLSRQHMRRFVPAECPNVNAAARLLILFRETLERHISMNPRWVFIKKAANEVQVAQGRSHEKISSATARNQIAGHFPTVAHHPLGWR